MERQEFNEKIKKQYEEFKKRILELTKEEIYAKAFEIDFKMFLAEYLQSKDNVSDYKLTFLIEIEEDILETLYNQYLNEDGSYTYFDMCDELIDDFLSFFGYEESEDFIEDEDYSEQE